jgi:hypothetical protein
MQNQTTYYTYFPSPKIEEENIKKQDEDQLVFEWDLCLDV